MAAVRKEKGTRLLSKNSGLMFCENCEKIVGSVNIDGYMYINLSFRCTCENDANIEIIRDKHKNDISQPVNRMPGRDKGRCNCRKCGVSMFSVIEDRVESYSFFVECKCGEKYDTIPTFESRLGETLELYKKAKEKA